MPLRYKRSLKETNYSIAKIGKKQNTLDSIDSDSLPLSELIAQIDTNLKHLKGQKKILQNAKDGKTWSYKFSLNEKKDKKKHTSCTSKYKSECCDVFPKIVNNEIVKVTDAYTQIGSSLNNLNREKKRIPSKEGQNVHLSCDNPSFNAEMEIYEYRSSVRKVSSKINNVPNTNSKQFISQKHKTFSFEKHSSKSHQLSPRGRNVERTKSSIRRHAKLSKEILDYAKRIASEKSNEDKTRKEISSDVYNSSPQSPNKVFSKKSPDGKKRYDKMEHRKDDEEISNNLTDTTWSWKSHNVNTIKPKVIDDTTYSCPENPEQNGYLILPYVGNTSGDNVSLNISPKPESQQSSKPSRSIGNGRKSKTYESDNELPQNVLNCQKMSREKSLIQSSYKSKYISHNFLETTWESHTNREGPLCSKFDTSHNHIRIPTNNYRSHYYDHNDHSVQSFSQNKNEMKLLPSSINSNTVHTKAISKPLRSDHQFHSPIKLAPEMEQSERSITEFTKNNKGIALHLQLQKQSLNEASPSSESIIHAPEKNYSTESFLKNDKINNQAFVIEPDKINLKDNSASTLSWQPEKLINFREQELDQSPCELDDTNNDFQVKTSIVKQTQPFKKQETVLGAISKRATLLNLDKETQKLTLPPTMKAPVKDTKQEQILKKDNFETTASSKESSSVVSWTPRNKLTFSDSEMLKEVYRTIQYNDLISKSLCFESGAVSKKNTFQDQPRLSDAKNYVQHKNSLPVKDKQLIPRTSQVSPKNKSAPFQNISQLRISVDDKDLAHLSLSAKIKEYETQDFYQNSQRSKTKINVPTGGVSLKLEPEPTSQKNASQDNQSVTSHSELNFKQNNYELGAISKQSLNKNEYEIEDVSRKSSQKINFSTGEISPTHLTTNDITSKANQTFYLKSNSNHSTDVGVLTSFPSILSGSKLDSTEKVSAKSKNFDFISKLQSSLSLRSLSLPDQSKTYESWDISQKSPKTEPKIYATEKDTFKVHQSDEKKILECKHIADKEVSKTFSSTLNGSEVGAIQKSPNSNPELNNSTKRMLSYLETLSKKDTNNQSDEKVSTTSRYGFKEYDSRLISNGVKEPESSTTCKNILSQQSLPKANKSSASEYLELFWNDKGAVKNIFRTSTSKFKQKPNLSGSSHDINNNKPVQANSSLVVLNSDKLEEDDISSRSKLNSILGQNLKTEESRTKRTDKNVEIANNFNLTKPKTPDSHMPFTFPLSEEELPSVSVKSKLTNNPTENKLDEHLSQNSPSSLCNSRLKKTKGNGKNEKHAFLSDTIKQNITVEGVSRETSDLLQHLQNRVKDCDEKVKTQKKELEKLKTNCKIFEPLTSIERNRNGEKEKQESAAKELLENIGIGELIEPLSRKDASENDLKEENSYRCIFCELEKSTSDCSEEIPLFTGCECMKEDYYKIMRIAYDK